MTITSTTVGKIPKKNGVALIANKRVRSAVLGWSLKNDRMIFVHFQGKPFIMTVIQVYAPITNAEEAKVEWFYEDVQDLLELTCKKYVLFIIGQQKQDQELTVAQITNSLLPNSDLN